VRSLPLTSSCTIGMSDITPSSPSISPRIR
jgi:hypothetical protein